jgi:hypothetical protein
MSQTYASIQHMFEQQSVSYNQGNETGAYGHDSYPFSIQRSGEVSLFQSSFINRNHRVKHRCWKLPSRAGITTQPMEERRFSSTMKLGRPEHRMRKKALPQHMPNRQPRHRLRKPKLAQQIAVPVTVQHLCLVGEKWVKSYCGTFHLYLTNIIRLWSN